MKLERAKAYIFGVGAVLASAWLTLTDGADSFPLSTFPMFSHPPGKPWVHTVVGIDAAGESEPIAPRLVANSEALQTAVAIARAVRSGRKATRRLCETVAEKVAREADLDDVVRVEVRSDRYDPVAYFTRGTTPLKSRLRASCRVPR